MNRSWFHLVGTVALAASLSGPAVGLAAGDPDKSIRDALAEVNSQCPDDYPDVVSPLPEEGAFRDEDSSELMRMLESWNPALRSAAARELGLRGDELIPVLMEGTRSDHWTIRAGSATALGAIIRRKLSDWKEYHPEIDDARKAQEKIRAGHADLADEFVRLTGDPELTVRVAALEGLSHMAPQTPEAATAVLRLCTDEDEYLAQGAMIALEKNFGVEAIQQEKVIAALQEAMRAPLPRGRGHVMNLIMRMDERAQRRFIPVLLEHLDWQPDRDTMFGAGGQEAALRLLTRLQVKEVIPRIPKLMFKTMRGPGLFEPCLESAKAFGRDAKVILPELRAMIPDFEGQVAQADARRRPGLEQRLAKLRETVAFLENA